MSETHQSSTARFPSVFLGRDAAHFRKLTALWPKESGREVLFCDLDRLEKEEKWGDAHHLAVFLWPDALFDYARLHTFCAAHRGAISLVLLDLSEAEHIPRSVWSRVAVGVSLEQMTEESMRLLLDSLVRYHAIEGDQKKIKQTRELLSQSAEDNLWEWDCVLGKLSLHAGCERLLGYETGELGGLAWQQWLLLAHPDERQSLQHVMWGAWEAKEPSFFYETRFLRKDGRRVWVQLRGMCLRDAQQQPLRMIGTMMAMVRRMPTEQHLTFRARCDVLTGFLHREAFLEALREEWREAVLVGRQIALFLFDIDRFSQINDSYGFSVGDRFLQEIARRLGKNAQQGALLGRVGSDEFAVLVRDVTSQEALLQIAREWSKALSEPFQIESCHAHPSVTFGIAQHHEKCRTAEDLLGCADLALRQAQKERNGGFHLFDFMAEQKLRARLQLERDLWEACERGELSLVYQPLVSLQSGLLQGFEVLLRWMHPSRGVVSPIEFIPLAESSGAIIKIGWWVLEQACRQIALWNQGRDQGKGLAVHVNFSSKQLATPHLLERIQRLLQETEISPDWLKIEITESILMEDMALAVEILKGLRALGIEICMDDFGTGYSSLSYLHQFPVDVIKIDRSFVNRLEEQGGRSIVRMILSLAQHLEMGVIAEGIETEHQRRLLLRDGCTAGQGYYFSRPLTVGDASVLVRAETYLAEQVASFEALQTSSLSPTGSDLPCLSRSSV